MSTSSTLKSISEKLNISISTVSRALKNHPDISEKTKRKVKDLAELLEYEPNTYAVNLRTNSSKIIGLIVPYISNFFYESFISAVEEEARKSGYTLMVLQTGDNVQQELDSIRICRKSRVAGVLISMAAHSTLSVEYQNHLVLDPPVIFFDKVPEQENYNRVCLADEDAAIMAAEKIIDHSKKNVLAIFGNPDLSITKLRLNAFEKTLRTKATNTTILIRFAISSSHAAEIITEAFKTKNQIDQVFCMSDEILIGAMKAMNSLQIKIPQKVGVLAMSNGIIPGLFNPAITYIETSGYKLGKLAIKKMFDHINNKKTFSRTIIHPSILVEGKSM